MKQYVIAMAAACTLFLASCGNSPEKVVTDFYTANKANDFEKAMTYTDLPEACKSAALRWVQKQPRMKTAKLSDIERVRKVTYEGKTHYEITAKGRTFRTDN